jgi:hypothetical protein
MIAKIIVGVCAFLGMALLFRTIAPGIYYDGFKLHQHFISYGFIVSMCTVGLVFKNMK